MQAIALEFKHEPGNLAANGTDVIFHLDGRWGASRKLDEIHMAVDRLRTMNPRMTAYKRQLFVGYTYLGRSDYRPGPHVEMTDHNPPAWFLELGDADPTFAAEIRRNKYVRAAAFAAGLPA